ncbi:MAG: AraC family transcriptional regulator [Phormidesmis sp.]
MTSNSEFIQLRDTSIQGVELFEARLVKHRFGRHFHDTYTLGLNEGGLGQCLHRNSRHDHRPGMFTCINPGEVHTGEVASAQGWKFRNLYVSQAVARFYLSELGYPTNRALPCFPHIVVEDIPSQRLFRRLFAALERSAGLLAERSENLLEQQSLLLCFFSRFFAKHTRLPDICDGKRAETQSIMKVRAYIGAHCTDNFSIRDLASLVNLNPYYLIRCFREQVGTSPHQYKLHCQLQRAKQAMLEEDSAIAQIAANCGFYDQSHLSRTFKRALGVSPGRYREVNFVQARR